MGLTRRAKKELRHTNTLQKQKIAYMLAKKHIQIYDGKKSAQFIFSKKEKVNYFEVKDGRKV